MFSIKSDPALTVDKWSKVNMKQNNKFNKKVGQYGKMHMINADENYF